MDKSTHEIRLAQWQEIVHRCQARPAGQSAKAWLAENGISNKQYYYWLRQVRRDAYEKMKNESLPTSQAPGKVVFAEIPSDLQEKSEIGGFRPDAIIRIGGVTAAVSNTASAELLNRISEAARHAC